MAKRFRKVAILGRHEDPRVAEPISVLAEYLGQAGVEVLAATDMSLGIEARRLPEEELADTADLIIAIGGDGAMLYAGQLARRGDIPLLGINRGRLGFLADVTPEKMPDSVLGSCSPATSRRTSGSSWKPGSNARMPTRRPPSP